MASLISSIASPPSLSLHGAAALLTYAIERENVKGVAWSDRVENDEGKRHDFWWLLARTVIRAIHGAEGQVAVPRPGRRRVKGRSSTEGGSRDNDRL
ncbi:hypothetical protein [Bradyrhizobium lablabi]|uniref:hypothetical protein n=1 Tax=Bradyrhizobium lablabi TaxID=722472 RepID=UPI001BA52DF2|nr:hypothetical protein [Bradyrhizobium lablabi]MBR0691591.1 hypothetical protein [Bradyrhizobium lablabi]